MTGNSTRELENQIATKLRDWLDDPTDAETAAMEITLWLEKVGWIDPLDEGREPAEPAPRSLPVLLAGTEGTLQELRDLAARSSELHRSTVDQIYQAQRETRALIEAQRKEVAAEALEALDQQLHASRDVVTQILGDMQAMLDSFPEPPDKRSWLNLVHNGAMHGVFVRYADWQGKMLDIVLKGKARVRDVGAVLVERKGRDRQLEDHEVTRG